MMPKNTRSAHKIKLDRKARLVRRRARLAAERKDAKRRASEPVVMMDLSATQCMAALITLKAAPGGSQATLPQGAALIPPLQLARLLSRFLRPAESAVPDHVPPPPRQNGDMPAADGPRGELGTAPQPPPAKAAKGGRGQ